MPSDSSDSFGTKYSKIEIYQPSDDSYFFAEFLKKHLSSIQPSIEGDSLRNSPPYSPILPQPASSMTMLDMGTGSGILAETASEFIDKKNITTADINPEAVKLLKQKGFNSIKTNLFEKIKTKFDLITFNAPYLPEDKREPKDSQVATTGGKRGDEISIKFLKQVRKHLDKNGKAFLLISTITPMENLKNFHPRIVARRKLFLESLLILEILP